MDYPFQERTDIYEEVGNVINWVLNMFLFFFEKNNYKKFNNFYMKMEEPISNVYEICHQIKITK